MNKNIKKLSVMFVGSPNGVRLKKFLGLNEIGFEKYVYALMYDLTNKASHEQLVCFNEKPVEKNTSSYSIKNLILSVIIGFKVLLQFTAFFFWKHLFCNIPSVFKELKRMDVKYLFLTFPAKVNKFSRITGNSMEQSLVAYVPHSNMQILKKIRGAKDIFYLNPTLPSLKDIFSIFYYAFFVGPQTYDFIKKSVGRLDFSAIQIHNRAIISMLNMRWGKIKAQKIKKQYPNIVLIFDMDNGGALLGIASEARKLSLKTIHFQHGTFLEGNVFYVPPVSEFMFCCSKREHEILIAHGLENKKLFTVGAPLQTIKDENKVKISKFKYKVTVLATTGPLRVIQFSASVLSMSTRLNSSETLLRFHPSSNDSHKELYRQALPQSIVSSNTALIDDIMSGEIVITFSIDTLINCINRKTRTIFIPNSNDFYPNCDFLNAYPFVKITENPQEIDKCIDYFLNEYIDDEKNYTNKLIENFGEFNWSNVSENIQNALCSVYNY